MPQVPDLRRGLRESPSAQGAHHVDETQSQVFYLFVRIHPLNGPRETHGPAQEGVSAYEGLYALFARRRRPDVPVQPVRQDILRLAAPSYASQGGTRCGKRKGGRGRRQNGGRQLCTQGGCDRYRCSS